MADRPQPPASQTETIPRIFVRYLKATSDDERRAVVEAHPSLFHEAVVGALDEARGQLTATMREVREACRMIDAVSGGLQYTGSSVELQPGEVKSLLDEDAILQNFANSLASLLASREKNGTLLPSAATPNATAAAAQSASSSPSLCGPPASRGPWYTQPALVLEVLSFLPAEEVLMEAESVCRSWQTWLFEPQVSRFFWVGCVQREFPQQLHVLLRTEGEDLFQSDWRSLAMLCVTEAEGHVDATAAEEGEEEAAASCT